MIVTKEDLGGNKVRLTVSVPAEVFRESLDKAYRAERGKFSADGFRKGNVPRPVIEARYGSDVFFDAALKQMLPENLTEAYKEAELNVVGQIGDVEVNSCSKNDGVNYSVTVYVVPEVELGPYEGLKADKHTYTVRDTDVERTLEDTRQQNVRWVPVERPSETGDTVTIDFLGKMDGVPFEGGEAKQFRLELGSGMMIPGFEEEIVGMGPGEDRTITVTFPEDYMEKSLAGKEATFDIHLHDISEKELPELDDEFAQDVSEANTLEELRNEIRKSLQKSVDQRSESMLEADLVSQIVQATDLEIPPPMVQQRANEELQALGADLRQRGMPFEVYLAMQGLSAEEFQAQLARSSENGVKVTLVLSKLLDELGIEASEEEVLDAIRPMAERSGLTVEEARTNVGNGQLHAIIDGILTTKLFAKLKDLAEITVVEDETPDYLFGAAQQSVQSADASMDEQAAADGSEASSDNALDSTKSSEALADHTQEDSDAPANDTPTGANNTD